eukprot:258529_1
MNKQNKSSPPPVSMFSHCKVSHNSGAVFVNQNSAPITMKLRKTIPCESDSNEASPTSSPELLPVHINKKQIKGKDNKQNKQNKRKHKQMVESERKDNIDDEHKSESPPIYSTLATQFKPTKTEALPSTDYSISKNID